MPLSSVRALPRRLVVATANSGKLREFRSLLTDLPFVVESLGDLGLIAPEETGTTFLENALLKANHAVTVLAGVDREIAAIADDSGLEVDALGGAPGIFSARYSGPLANDAANNAKLIAALEGVPQELRRARYRCALVMVFADRDIEPMIADGVWEGYVLAVPQGSGGFGYDPLFWLPEYSMTAAQLAPQQKDRLSHRGKAMQKLRAQLAAREALAVRG